MQRPHAAPPRAPDSPGGGRPRTSEAGRERSGAPRVKPRERTRKRGSEERAATKPGDAERTARPFSIRPAKSEDFPALLAIDAACFAAEIRYSQPEMSRYMKARGAFTLVAEAADTSIAGFILGVAHPRGGHVITIDVLPRFRRAGLGRQLLQAAETRMAAAGARHVQLEAAVDNAGALAFYRDQGYRAVAVLPGYYPGGLDGWRLVKRLDGEAQPGPPLP